MSDPITNCRSCGTDWSDCDVLDDGRCAACWRKESDRLRAERDELRIESRTIEKLEGELQAYRILDAAGRVMR